MKLEQEAQELMHKKKIEFSKSLREYSNYTEKFITDNLYQSHELDNALRSLQASVLWAEESANEYGIK